MKFTIPALATAVALTAMPAFSAELVLSIGSRGYGPAGDRNLARYEEMHRRPIFSRSM